MLEQNIADLFHTYFEVVFAHSQELKQEAYRIRYEVYCAELGFEDPSNFPNKLEIDGCDIYSHHYLIKHKNSGAYAGTVRLVDPSLVSNSVLCPIEEFCSEAITDSELNPSKAKKGSICEVSRLAVPSTFRRRIGEQGKPFVYESDRISMDPEEKKAFPYIAIGLYLSAAAHFVNERQLEHIFVMMEPRLALHLRRVGIGFKQIGEVVEYHGKRAPYHVDEERLLIGMHPAMRELYDTIENSVVNQLKIYSKVDLVAKAG